MNIHQKTQYARLTIIAALMFMALRPAQAADIPQQYRGHWCDTKWETILRRCTERDEFTMIIGRDGYGIEDWECTFEIVRKDERYGGHRIWMMCRDDGGAGKGQRSQERWWLGSHGTRLQILQMRPK
jgi:hypothetical protein